MSDDEQPAEIGYVTVRFPVYELADCRDAAHGYDTWASLREKAAQAVVAYPGGPFVGVRYRDPENRVLYQTGEGKIVESCITRPTYDTEPTPDPWRPGPRKQET